MLHRELKWLAGKHDSAKAIINFLPGLDPYVMGYKLRDRYLDREQYNHVFDRSGNAAPTILVDGRIAGIWDYAAGECPVVKFHLFDHARLETQIPEITRKAAEVGSFISGTQARLKECRTMVPLTEMTPGAVMSPLKGQ